MLLRDYITILCCFINDIYFNLLATKNSIKFIYISILQYGELMTVILI
jgi:hypothetical protein